MINIVLVSPEIPQNTGNIARTCAATGCALHLVKPLGFSIDDKHLKRAGLDYWNKVVVGVYDCFEELEEKHPEANFYLVETDGSRFHTEVKYPDDVFFVFGKETKGLPKELIEKYKDQLVRLPMRKGLRSLNLSNAAAVMVYEALRQRNFDGLV